MVGIRLVTGIVVDAGLDQRCIRHRHARRRALRRLAGADHLRHAVDKVRAIAFAGRRPVGDIGIRGREMHDLPVVVSAFRNVVWNAVEVGILLIGFGPEIEMQVDVVADGGKVGAGIRIDRQTVYRCIEDVVRRKDVATADVRHGGGHCDG